MSEITNASLTTDIVLFAESGGLRHVLLIRRGWAPYAGHWALPVAMSTTGSGSSPPPAAS
ncbi:hypothetical protein GCM10020366_00060 [Saccharopolyspora gregorii]|uniref:NUDIX hydrolase n=1 Tax=Saccharopolyspora gregorii TaxID=33914 RepID=A0ABP6RHI9_9PSEU